ncbi:MAG: undecaprenyl-diphosphate phosphatase, partial [Pygmaiobacter sp.]
MSIIDGLLQGMLQGAMAFLPLSGDGHLALYQHFTGNSGEGSLPFSLMLHLGMLFSVCFAYRKDIWSVLCTLFRMLRELTQKNSGIRTRDEYRRMSAMLLLAYVPLPGFLLLADWVAELRADSDIAAEGIFFFFTGALLYLACKCVKGKKTAGRMSGRDALVVGVFWGMGILPGVSSSGSALSSGLLLGYSREYCVKFSFLLGLPVMLGTVMIELKNLLGAGVAIEWAPALAGMIAAALIGFLCIRLIRYLVMSDQLVFFSYYAIVL